MKLQLDTASKTIKIEGEVCLGQLVKDLEKLLPKDSPFGHWKDFKLETNTVINNWGNPIYIPCWGGTPNLYVGARTNPCIGDTLTVNATDGTLTTTENTMPLSIVNGDLFPNGLNSVYNIQLN